MTKSTDLYSEYPTNIKDALLELRSIILSTAKNSKEIGKIEETLRWNQPTFLTSESKSGSMIRIDQYKNHSDKVAIYFHCQTKLVSIFRLKYGDKLQFEGNRAIILDTNKRLPQTVIKDCAAMALRYNLIKDQFEDL